MARQKCSPHRCRRRQQLSAGALGEPTALFTKYSGLYFPAVALLLIRMIFHKAKGKGLCLPPGRRDFRKMAASRATARLPKRSVHAI